MTLKLCININVYVNVITYKLTIFHRIYQLLLSFVKWPDDGRYGRN